MHAERSAALQRLGITEWMPREAGASHSALPAHVVPVEPPAVVAPTPARISNVLGNEPAQAEPRVGAAAVVAPPVATPVNGNKASSAVASPHAEIVPATLRGRVIGGQKGAPLLVLAMAEKSERDGLLATESASGALLQAMLACLGQPATVAMLGVGGGEAIAVPATVLVLGDRSARLLLGDALAAPLRGRVHLFGEAKVVVSYHPDELRQNGSLKRLAWDDLRLLASLMALSNRPSTNAGRP